MKTVREIYSTLGRDVIADKLDVTTQQLSNAITDEKFPSNWFVGIDELCRKNGIETPRHLFPNMRGIDSLSRATA